MSATLSAATRGAGAGRTRWQRLRAWFQPQVSIGVREQRDQAMLLIAVAVAVLPHFDHLPLWSKVVLAGMWAWRAWLAQTLNPAPSRIVIVALLALLTTAVWVEHGTLWGRDASVHFLLVLLGLKVLEMRARRDVFVIVVLSLFVLETEFLFDQSISTALVTLFAVGLLFYVLLSVSLPVGDVSTRGKLLYLARVFILALPVTLTMFFLFPRLPVPVWNIAASDPEGASGLSEFMRPGSIRNLLRDDAVALRAQFQGAVPMQRNLYWRGPVFGYFDGDSWTPLPTSAEQSIDPADIKVDARSAIDYWVTLEATRRRDLIGLEFTAAIDGVPATQGRLTSTMELRSLTPVTSRRRYLVRSYLSYSAAARADPGTLSDWLQLPPQSNPRALRWAGEFKVQALAKAPAGASPERALVDAMLQHFHREAFRYSIKAPMAVGDDSIDQFLFDTRVGYCEHYASAFTFVMRAMGVPARVVTGYQGGEINPVDGYLTVRQSDAHAWAEVWLNGAGWVRVDPTAAVAPDRVERTLQGAGVDDAARGRDAGGWLHQWRLDREALENAWNQWFLAYSSERQRALVSWIGLHPNAQNIALVAIGAFALLLGLLTLVSLRRPVVRDPLAELTQRLRRKLQRAGVPVPATMGLRDMESHLAGRLEASSHAEARRLLRHLNAARYAPAAARMRAADVAQLRVRLRRWRAVRLRA